MLMDFDLVHIGHLRKLVVSNLVVSNLVVSNLVVGIVVHHIVGHMFGVVAVVRTRNLEVKT